MKYKLLIILISALASLSNAEAANMLIFNCDASEFPIVTAQVYVFDYSGSPRKDLSKNLFRIYEQDEKVEDFSLSCPDNSHFNSISSVLTIDVSHSMLEKGKLDIAKSAAKAWIYGLDDASECALTSFHTTATIEHDFTNGDDVTGILDKVDQLTTQDGTNYQLAFMDPISGAIPLLKSKAKQKKILVFMTDDYPDNVAQLNVDEIIQEAQDNGITIYTIALGMKKTPLLERIAEETGGECFGEIASSQQAEEIYLLILQSARGIGPCELEWESELNCINARIVDIYFRSGNTDIQEKVSYAFDDELLPSVYVIPDKRDLGFVEPGQSKSAIIRFRALNRDAHITGIRNDNPDNFSMDYDGQPFVLADGQDTTFSVEFHPESYGKKTAIFEVVGDHCKEGFLEATGGRDEYQDPEDPTTPAMLLNLIEPNGGEKLLKNSTFKAAWEGVDPEDKLGAYVSLNNGTKWTRLPGVFTGLETEWKVPSTVSSQCLFKIMHEGENDSDPDYEHIYGWGELTGIAVNRDGTMLATRSECGLIYIWDLQTQKIIWSAQTSSGRADMLEWSPIGNYLAYAANSRNVSVLDANTGKSVYILTGFTSDVLSIAWSPVLKYLACGDKNGYVKLFSPNTGDVLRSMHESNTAINDMSWHGNGKKLACACSDNSVIVWDIDLTVPTMSVLEEHSAAVITLSYSPDGKHLASGDAYGDLVLWDDDGNYIETYSSSGAVYDLKWYSNDEMVYACLYDFIVYNKIGTYPHRQMHHPGLGNKLEILKDQALVIDDHFRITFYDIPINDAANFVYSDVMGGYMSSVTGLDVTSKERLAISGSANQLYTFSDNYGLVQERMEYGDEDINAVAWSYDSKNVASVTNGGMLVIWAAVDGSVNVDKVAVDNPASQAALDVDWCQYDAFEIATCGSDNKVRIWDRLGSLERTLNGHSQSVNCLDFAPDQYLLASGSCDGTVIIWDFSTGKKLQTLLDMKDTIVDVSWNHDATMMSALTDENYIYTYMMQKTGKLKIYKISKSLYNIYTLDWHPVEDVMVASQGYYGVSFWDGLSGLEIDNYSLSIDNRIVPVVNSRWSKEKLTRLYLGTSDGTVHSMALDSMIMLYQSDISDSLWSITAPAYQATDINMGDELVGQMKYLVNDNFLMNNGDLDVRIDSIYIKDNDDDIFGYNVDKRFPFVMYGGTGQSATFSFEPTGPGEETATIVVITEYDTLFHQIRGNGVNILLNHYNVDFGTVQIGSTRKKAALVVRNSGSAALNFDVVEDFDADSDFIFDDLGQLDGFKLETGQGKIYDLTFAPKTPGYKLDSIELNYDLGYAPVYVYLRGTGTQDEPVIGCRDNHSFNLICRDTLTSLIEIENLGRNPLEITDAYLQGSGASRFELEYDGSVITLDSGDTHSFPVSFISDVITTASATLTIISNAYNGNEYHISLDARRDMVFPQFFEETIYLGEVCPGQVLEYQEQVTNSGSADAMVECYSSPSVTFTNSTSFTLGPGDSQGLDINLTAPEAEGMHREVVYLADKLCGNIDSVEVWADVKHFELERPGDEEVIEVYKGSRECIDIVYRNETDTEICIESAHIDAPFEIDPDLQFPICLEMGDDTTIEVCYQADDTITYRADLVVELDKCDIVYANPVSNQTIPVSLELTVPAAEGSTGETVAIPLYLLGTEDIDSDKIPTFYVRLGFNKTVLYPKNIIRTYIKDDKRYCWTEVPTTVDTENKCHEVNFEVMLGTDGQTEITADSCYSDYGNMTVRTNSGTFTVNNICRKGGDRYAISVQPIGLTIAPNPASGTLDIDVTLNENGPVTLELYTLLGNRAALLQDKYLRVGAYVISKDIMELPAGTYNCVLKTNTSVVSQRVFIVK